MASSAPPIPVGERLRNRSWVGSQRCGGTTGLPQILSVQIHGIMTGVMQYTLGARCHPGRTQACIPSTHQGVGIHKGLL